jgi:molecular chaperone DnaJ
MSKDYYEILGVPRKSSLREIKAAYRKLARKYHPDVNPGDASAERRFKEISEAYQVLSDPEKRKRFDQFGTIDPREFAGAGGGDPGFRFSGFDFSDFDVGDAGPRSGFADIFSEIFGARRKKRPSREPRRGEDIQYVVNLSFMDAINGITTDVNVNRPVSCKPCGGSGRVLTGGTQTCPSCGGRGRRTIQQGALRFETGCDTCQGTGVLSGEVCKLCGGSGRSARAEKITVRIPAGVDNGSRVRVAGKGAAGVNGGPAGDLYIITNVAHHPFFTRRGNNIYVTVPITVSEAALGTKLEVPTIDGTAAIRIPPSTQSGQRFRLRGRGPKALRGDGRGDQYVEVKIVLPKVIDEGAKELYRKLKEAERWNPRKDLFTDI